MSISLLLLLEFARMRIFSWTMQGELMYLSFELSGLNYQYRVVSQRHLFTYGEPIPVEQLVQAVCDQKQGYTQFGGLRPYGVSFLIGGWLVFLFKRHFQSAKLLSLGTKSLDFNCIKVTLLATTQHGRWTTNKSKKDAWQLYIYSSVLGNCDWK